MSYHLGTDDSLITSRLTTMPAQTSSGPRLSTGIPVVAAGADPSLIPDMSTLEPLLMTEEQIRLELLSLNMTFGRFSRRVPADNPRFVALVNRRTALHEEQQRRINRSAYFSVAVYTAPAGILLGVVASRFFKISTAKGGLAGGALGALAPLVYPYLFAAFYYLSGARNI